MNWCERRRPNGASIQRLRQHREDLDRELAEVGDVDLVTD
jgi:hypothetical protein